MVQQYFGYLKSYENYDNLILCIKLDLQRPKHFETCVENATVHCLLTIFIHYIPGMTTAAPTSLPPTPSGFFYGCSSSLWKPYKGNCYLFMKNGVSWNRASQYCASKGGNLASIVDENEQNFVFSQLPG